MMYGVTIIAALSAMFRLISTRTTLIDLVQIKLAYVVTFLLGVVVT